MRAVWHCGGSDSGSGEDGGEAVAMIRVVERAVCRRRGRKGGRQRRNGRWRVRRRRGQRREGGGSEDGGEDRWGTGGREGGGELRIRVRVQAWVFGALNSS